MNTEKNQFVLPQGTTEITIREGAAINVLDQKPPVKTAINGTIHAPLAYLSKRVCDIDQHKCYIVVDRENVQITLIVNESDEYTRGSVVGKLELYPKFIQFGINNDRRWDPSELGLFIKMNRAFFQDKKANMELVSTFMNFRATVSQEFDREQKQNGSNKDNFGQIVNSNIPDTFKLFMPIFKGMGSEELEIETVASIDGRDVTVMLISPGAEAILEEIRDTVIDKEIEELQVIAPDIVIIEK